jgi:predicted Zn-dependent protease
MNARLFLAAAAALGAAVLAPAQFDFGKLTKALDTAKDAGKALKGFTGMPIEEEREIGDSVALEVIAKYGGIDRDEEITKRVNLVGRSLARYSDRPDLDWRFAVLQSDTINAFSAPAGFVFITRGLYDRAANDDELAAILAHEIGHITGRHAVKIVMRADATSAIAKQVAARSNQTRQLDAQLSQFGLKIDKILNTIFEKGYDPQWEYAADQEAWHLAQRTGYASDGLKTVLTELEADSGEAKTAFSTHPPLKDRLAHLDAASSAPSKPKKKWW